MNFRKIIVFLLVLLLVGCTSTKPEPTVEPDSLTITFTNKTSESITECGFTYGVDGKMLGSISDLDTHAAETTVNFKLYKDNLHADTIKVLNLSPKVTIQGREYSLGDVSIANAEYGKTYAFEVRGNAKDGYHLAQPSDITINNNNNNKSDEVEFPYENYIGYWNSKSNDQYVRIYPEGADYKWEVDYREALPYYAEGTQDIYTLKSCKEIENGYLVELVSQNESAMTLAMVGKGMEEPELLINDLAYEYVGQESGQARMAYEYRLLTNLAKQIQGYWNCESNNEFFYIGTEPNSEPVFTYAMWMTGGGKSGYVTKVEMTQEGDRILTVYYPKVEPAPGYGGQKEETVTYTLDFKEITSNTISIGTKVFHYAGATEQEAYGEYSKR